MRPLATDDEIILHTYEGDKYVNAQKALFAKELFEVLEASVPVIAKAKLGLLQTPEQKVDTLALLDAHMRRVYEVLNLAEGKSNDGSGH